MGFYYYVSVMISVCVGVFKIGVVMSEGNCVFYVFCEQGVVMCIDVCFVVGVLVDDVVCDFQLFEWVGGSDGL